MSVPVARSPARSVSDVAPVSFVFVTFVNTIVTFVPGATAMGASKTTNSLFRVLKVRAAPFKVPAVMVSALELFGRVTRRERSVVRPHNELFGNDVEIV